MRSESFVTAALSAALACCWSSADLISASDLAVASLRSRASRAADATSAARPLRLDAV
jgi:hypothetical protein